MSAERCDKRFGVCTRELKLISDLVTGTSPQFARVQLVLRTSADDAARMLDGRRLRDRIVRVKALKFDREIVWMWAERK